MTRKDSWNSVLLSMTQGERRYFECDLDNYQHMMRTINTPLSRRPDELNGMRFTTTLFTAVSAAKAGDVRYLICLERAQ